MREIQSTQEIESLKKKIAELENSILELKKREAELKEVEKKFRNIFENATEGIFQTTPDGKILNANPSFAKIHGFSSPEEMIREIKDLARDLYVDPKDRQRLLELVEKEGKVNNFEVKMRKRDGSIQWISINMRAIKDQNGKTLYYEGTMQDVTERKLAEEALRESEERYRIAIENSNDGVAIVSDSTFLFVNKRFVKIFEYESPEEIIGRPVVSVVYPEDHEVVESITTKIAEGDSLPKGYEFRGITKTGRVIYIEVSVASISFKGRQAHLFYLRDITKRKESEKLLREEKERLNTLLENAPIGIALISENGVFKYVNPKFKEIFGYDIKDVPDGRTFLRRLFPDHETRKMVISGWIENVRNTQTGQKFPRIFTVQTKDNEKRIVNFIPVRLATKEHIIAFEDITERIEAEEALRRSKDELERLNRIKSKAIDHISHELKTPTSVLLGNIRIMKKRLKEMGLFETFREIVEAMERNVTRLLEISRETDEIFRSQTEFQSVSLTLEMEDFLRRLERMREIPQAIRFYWDAIKDWLSKVIIGESDDVHDVELGPFLKKLITTTKEKIGHREVDLFLKNGEGMSLKINQKILQTTLEGILKNAIENTPDGGMISVEVERNDENILIHIKDTGVGITSENLAHIFDGLFHTEATELYRSKRPYDFGAGGKGLELFMIKRYSLKYGFDISVKSERCIHIPTEKDVCPGDTSVCRYISHPSECKNTGGTTFTLSFPLPNP